MMSDGCLSILYPFPLHILPSSWSLKPRQKCKKKKNVRPILLPSLPTSILSTVRLHISFLLVFFTWQLADNGIDDTLDCSGPNSMIFPPFEQFQQASQQQQQQQLVVVSHGDEACLISPAEHYPGQGICSYLCKSWRLAPLFCHSAGEPEEANKRKDGWTDER